MKKLLQLKTMLLLCALIVGSGSVWAATTDTYTFTSKSWAATLGGNASNWTSGQDANALNATQGVQVTEKTSGANATSPKEFSNISKIVVTYSTNSSKGAGTIKVKVGSNTEKSFTPTTSGGTSDRVATFNFSPTESGSVKLTVNCTTNSIYIKSIAITYTSYTITATRNNNDYGTVSVDGTTITASPNSGYRVIAGDGGYTVTSGTATVINNEDNTFTVTPESDCNVQINFEEIPTRTLTMASNDDSYGSATALATSILEGAKTTITATPNDGYRFVNWSVEGEDSSVETATATSTTFTMGSEDATVTANFEAIPVWTLSSAVTPAAAGTVILGATSVREGANTTIEATPNSGYIFKNWSVEGTGASIANVNSASTTFTMGTANATVTAEFAATYTINWSVNGEIVQTETLETGTSLSDLFPDVSNIGTKTFVGWVTSSTVDADFEGEEFVTIAAATASANTTYYAVFATADGSEPTLTKLGSDATFSDGDNIVVVAIGTGLGMYQETINTTYVKNFEFDGEATTINNDSKKFWTLTAKNDSWKLGDATNGYLYTSGSNNLSVSNLESIVWTISWDNAHSAFTVKTGTRYLSCRTDLTTSNKDLYRLGGENTSTGTAFFDIYKFVSESITYSAYTTTVTETYTVSTNTDRYYGSYITSKKLDFKNAEGITAYIAKGFNNSKNAIVLQEVDVVPAGTAIIVKTDEKGGSADVEVTNDEESDVSENALVAGDGTTAWDDTDGYTYYYLASDLFHKATSGTLQSGKAYLKVANGDVPEARSFGFVFDEEEATGINTVAKDAESGQFFNLAGQRVAQPTKGLYIVNGRKVIVK